MASENEINKDLILREKLAIQRTVLANQSTFLSFLRTAMYFLVAAISLNNLLGSDRTQLLEVTFYVVSAVLFVTGSVNYFIQKRKIVASEQHVGDFKIEYLDKK